METGVLIAERFVLEGRVGSGGHATVFRARDRATGNTVAIKFLHEMRTTGSQRFIAEARILSELRHPAIVRYVTHGVTNSGELYLAMEWLDGIDLGQRLTQGRPSTAESVALGQRVAEGLGQAHARGVVHRDVKPTNLLLVDGDMAHVKLLDFGVARMRTLSGTTKAGAIIGTPGYMAPEQARGAVDLDARADVFSLGCVLFECLTGKPAFAGEHVMAVLAKILLDEAPRLRQLRANLPRALDDLVARMLAKEPADRPRDGTAVATELAAVSAEAGLGEGGSVYPGALTGGERRLLAVVAMGPPPSGASGEPVLAAMRDVVIRHGGKLEPLLDGSVVATLLGTGAATDQAAGAARCALALRAIRPGAPMALTTGRVELRASWPAGEAIDRAASLVRASREGASTSHIQLDDVTAGLLGSAFELLDGQGGLSLAGEREAVEVGRTLLGREGVFVGREREIGILSAIYAEVTNEPVARLVLVTAAAGVGKSRLRYELVRRLEALDERPEVWIGQGDPVGAGSAFGIIARALGHAAALTGKEPRAVREKLLRARVARCVDRFNVERVTEFLGELMSTPLGAAPSVQLRAARADAMLMGDQLRRAWEDFVRAECAHGPVLIVLDDLQWGDLPSIKLVEAALRNLADQPLMVLAMARPEVEDRFPNLWAGRVSTEMRLGPLTRKASEKLATQALGPNAAPADIERIIERAGGNAFFLEELVRGVASGRGDALPDTVLAMVQARLERLLPEERRVLRAASVFGQTCTPEGIAALVGVPPGEPALGDAITELVSQEYLTRQGRSDGGALSFRHATVREAAYAMLTDDDRVLGHQLAGGWLEQTGATDAGALAEHFERGKLEDRAMHWHRRAAEQALEGNDLGLALSHADRAVACGATGTMAGSLRLLQAHAHRWRGEFEEAAGRAAEAMGLLTPHTGHWFEAAGEAAIAGSKLGAVDRLLELAGELSAERAIPGEEPALVVAAMRTATYLFFAGRAEAGASLLARTELLAQRVGESDPAVLGWAHFAQGTRAEFNGDPGEYLAHTEAASASFERAGDLRNACTHKLNVGYANMELGALEQAEKALRDARASAEVMGLANLVAVANHNLGLALCRAGSAIEARAVEQAAVDAFDAQKDTRMAAASRSYLAYILTDAGDLAGAEAEARASVAALPDRSPVRSLALATLARVLLARGKPEEALVHAEDAMRLFELLEGAEEGEALIRLAHAEALERCGQRDRATSALAAAAERLLVRSGRIKDESRRKSFLERIPENARTLALARESGP